MDALKPRQYPNISEEEMTDANQRNKAISSSAINRALADASAGAVLMDCNGFVHNCEVFVCLSVCLPVSLSV